MLMHTWHQHTHHRYFQSYTFGCWKLFVKHICEECMYAKARWWLHYAVECLVLHTLQGRNHIQLFMWSKVHVQTLTYTYIHIHCYKDSLIYRTVAVNAYYPFKCLWVICSGAVLTERIHTYITRLLAGDSWVAYPLITKRTAWKPLNSTWSKHIPYI
jgi:hypothetical protein